MEGNSVWALQMRDTEAGKVMNFKVVIDLKTNVNEVRYCEQVTHANVFLLKYFNFSCHLCERLTSHVWTHENFDEETYEVRGICLDCCRQI